MGVIKLKGLKFHSYHGVYENEQKNGNTFLVDITIKTDLSKSILSDNIDDTLDYSKVYEVVKKEMEIPSKLLENVAYRINKSIIMLAENSKVKTTVYKMNPPLNGDCEYSSVTLKTYK